MRPSTLVALVFAGLVQSAPLPQQHIDASIPAAAHSNMLSTPATVTDADILPKLIHQFADALSAYEQQYDSTTTTGQAPNVVKRSEPEPDAAETEADPELVTLRKRQQWPGFVKQIAQRIAGVISNSILGMIGSA